jgi:hypothetical protein
MLHKHSRRLPCGESLAMLIITPWIEFEIECFKVCKCMLTNPEKIKHRIFYDIEDDISS